MAEFLSPEWITELDDAARTSPALAALGDAGPMVVEQRVSDAPGGTVSYHVVVDERGARVRPGPAEIADLVVAMPYAAARALHAGTTEVRNLLRRGDIKIRGNPNALLARARVIATIDDVFAPLRSTTTFSSSPPAPAEPAPAPLPEPATQPAGA